MKNSFFYALPLLLFIGGCNSRSSDSEKKAKEINSEKIDSQIMSNQSADPALPIPAKADADFLVEAASGGMTAVQLGQLAQTNSLNREIKAFGDMMIKDHRKSREKLSTLATSKNMVLPDSISGHQQKIKERLGRKKGEAFDRAYISFVIDDHKKDIRAFRRAAENAADPEIRAFAMDQLPLLNWQLDTARNLQKKMGIPVGPPPYE
ncbi:DUF4142 domain-containing protein [Chitinophaga sp.]|uniref:DUF4142 domain-containing protein n=1 Tax=Chitinophaga sp. TaxID=1869181 RepID=UPI002D7EA79D|nr:DUF4142 domain-containing protein [Chitinophaga sp.]